MTKAPFFSIIVAVIRAKYLRAALTSVQEQDFSDWELIIINDASKEPIDEIVNEVLGDPRVHYMKNDVNQGAMCPARVWNQGLAIARGQFTLVLGDDDYYGQGFFSSLYDLAQKYPDVAHLRARLCTIDGGDNIRFYGSRLAEWEPRWDILYSRVYLRHALSILEHAFLTSKLREGGCFWELHKAWGTDDATVTKLSLVGGCASTNDAWVFSRDDGKNISTQPITPEMSLAIKELSSWQEKLVLENADSIQNFSQEVLLRAVREKEAEAHKQYILLEKQKTLRYKIKSQLKNLLSSLYRWV